MSLKVAAASWLLVSLGHTISAKDWQSTPQFQKLPTLASTCSRAGWYQGSAFFIVNALINYNWSQNPELLEQPVNKAIAGLITAIVWVSAGWYFKNGVKASGFATALAGAIQAWAVFN